MAEVFSTDVLPPFIEKILIGLPIPQIFLYEEARNRFLVIDGQQRLMSIYYFMNERFPRRERVTELRRIFDQYGRIPDNIFHDDAYFSKFNLSFSEDVPNRQNKFTGLNYSTLGEEYQTAFNLRTIRNIIIKQVHPKDDDSCIYEIFSRLNTGGVNLRPQEIRMCMYLSDFYNMLHRLNSSEEWRRLVNVPAPDLHMKDVEILLRGFAMLIDGGNYNPSMVKFLNAFSKKAKSFSSERVRYLEDLLSSFFDSCSSLSQQSFYAGLGRSSRFSTMIFESVFVAACEKAFSSNSLVVGKVEENSINELKTDREYIDASQSHTTDKVNVETRLLRARKIIRMK